MSSELDAREALRSGEALLAGAIEASGGGWVIWDLRSGTAKWSDRAGSMLGFEEGAPAHSVDDVLDRVHPSDRAGVEQEVEAALAEQRDVRLEGRLILSDRSLRRLSVSGRILREGGAPARVSAIIFDVTESTRRREELKESEARYRTLFESIDEGFMIADVTLDDEGRALDLRFVETNPAFERHLGLHGAEGRSLLQMEPGLEEHWLEAGSRIVRTGQPELFVSETRAESGRWFDVYAFRLGGPGSRRIAALFRDITERRDVIRRLEELNRTLEVRVDARTLEVRELAASLAMAEQETRRRLAAVLHNDLQQLLFGVQLRLDFLARDVADEMDSRLRTDLNAARAWMVQAIEITRQLSRDLDPPILRERGLEAALSWLAEEMAEKQGLEVRLETGENVDVSDENLRGLFFQSMRELLFNVAKHAGVGEAKLKLNTDREHLQVIVEDEGVGFDAEAVAGTGSGLAAMRERIRLVGGKVIIESVPGDGCRVTVSAPLRPRRRRRRGGVEK